MDWQPIEMAPMDGTAVLLAVEYEGNDVQGYVPWAKVPAVIGWWTGGAWECCFGDTHGGCPTCGTWWEFDTVQPTYWMPIPHFFAA